MKPGEKIHELMIYSDDAINTLEYGTCFVVQPAHTLWDNLGSLNINGSKQVDDGLPILMVTTHSGHSLTLYERRS